MVDRVLLPRNRVVGTQQYLAGADLRHQMAQAFRCEHHGVEIELVEIFGRLFLQRDVGLQFCGDTKHA